MATRSAARKSSSRFGLPGWLWKLALLGTFLVVATCLVYMVWASAFDIRQVEQIPDRSAVFDMDGRYYSRLAGENRVVVPIDKVSKQFIHALLAREDARFYEHGGVDPLGIARAIVRNVIHLHAREGASTLTQQLARNTFELGGKNIHRKLLEAFVAARIEEHYSKQQILEHYINRIYFGLSYYGVETASQAYFGKPAARLDLSESALIAGIIRGPNRFNPFKNPEGALGQRNDTLARMVDRKYITPAQEKAARNERLTFARRPPQTLQENYALGAVLDDLEQILSDEQIEEGGLRIYTSIDPALQTALQKAVDAQLRKVETQPGFTHPRRAQFTKEMADAGQDTPYLQGAGLAIDNRTGGIRAVVGGRDYFESRYNRAFLSPRQVGSTFKPFVYAAAFNRGLTPDSVLSDGPLQPGEIAGAGNWNPGNSDGQFRGPMSAGEGLIQSRNTVSVRVGNTAGVGAVRDLATKCGIKNVPNFPAIYLGAFEASLKDLTAAYSVFPNNGVRRQPYLIERIDDSEGRPIYRAAHVNASVLSFGTASTVTSVLTGVLEHGTAANARRLGLRVPAAGKTGTTNDYKDAWFIGYTGSLTCGVWVGLDKPETIMKSGYGAALALPIWVDTINAAPLARYPAPPLGSWRSAPAQPLPAERRNFFDSLRNLFRR